MLADQRHGSQVRQLGHHEVQERPERRLKIERIDQPRRGFCEEGCTARGFLRGRPGRLFTGQRHAFIGLPPGLLAHAEQINKDFYFGAQNFRHDRRQNVIDRPQ